MDQGFLREAIVDPAAVVAEGFEPSMPSFAGVLTEQQLIDLLAYLKTLR
ncbi:cytochrome c [Akkermansiaceae bacterium]|nr:cytochrome c [Akkermansiaceae bacterium]